MDNAVFRDTLFIQGVVVYMPVGQSGGGEKFLHGILVFSIKVVLLACTDGEEAVSVFPGTVVCPIGKRAEVCDISC